MQLDEISRRTSRIRLPHRQLARDAGLSKDTLCACFTGRHTPLHSTVNRLVDALRAEEIALRDYLLSLHPLPHTPDQENAA